eukprot:287497-Rhodomonas_salina.2
MFEQKTKRQGQRVPIGRRGWVFEDHEPGAKLVVDVRGQRCTFGRDNGLQDGDGPIVNLQTCVSNGKAERSIGHANFVFRGSDTYAFPDE